MADLQHAARAWNMLNEDPDGTLNDPDRVAFCCEHLLVIKDKKDQLVPFVLNATNRLIVEAYSKMRREGVPVRLVILKGRQQGSSTIVCALLMLELWGHGNREALVATEKKSGSAKNMYNKYQRFCQHFPLLKKGLRLKDIFIHYEDGEGFLLPNGSELRTEGETDITSYTSTSCHVSEAAFFYDFDTFMAMMMQSIPINPGTSVFVESTANRYGDGFFEYWNAAENATSGFRGVFAPWHIHEENVMPLPDNEEERTRFINSVGRKADQYDDETALMGQYNLTYEQLMFRRYKIDNDCRRSVDEFRRQYPSTAREAFLAVNRPVFDSNSIEFLTKRVTDPLDVGDMQPERVYARMDGTERAHFTENPSGTTEIWKPPEPFEQYVAGVDTAEGIEGGDFNALLLAKRDPFEIVAKIHGTESTKMDAIEFAKQVFYLGRWYNDADVLIEANHSSGGAIISLLDDWRYSNLMYEHEVFPSRTGEPPKEPRIGWLSNTGRRKDGIDLLANALLLNFNLDPPQRISDWSPVIPDRELLVQCSHMAWKSRGKPEAMRKGISRPPGASGVGYHDDLVFAAISLLFAHSSLPKPEPMEKRMVEKLGPDHPRVSHINPLLRRKYARKTRDEVSDPDTDWLARM